MIHTVYKKFEANSGTESGKLLRTFFIIIATSSEIMGRGFKSV